MTAISAGRLRAVGLLRPSPARAAAWVALAFPPLSVVFVFALLAANQFHRLERAGKWELIAVTLLLLGVTMSTVRRVRRQASGAPMYLRDELEFGGTLVGLAFATVAIFGPSFFPIVYLLTAFLVTFLSRPAAATLLGSAILFDALVSLNTSATEFLTHAVFLVLFGVLYHVVLATRVAAARRRELHAVEARLKEVEERARTFRLVSSGSQASFPGVKDDEKWLLASVKEVEGSVGQTLDLVETALRTHTAAVFLLGADDRSLKLYDCRSLSDRVQRERFSAAEGVVGALLKRGQPVRLMSERGVKGVTWYEELGPTVGSILAVPITEHGGIVRGVVVADRLTPEGFSDTDERFLATAAAQVLRAIEIERVLNYIRKNRDEKERFFRAIEELNRASSPDQVFLAVLESARQIATLDFCAVTLVQEEDGKRWHRVARMTGVTTPGRALEGQRFPDNNGLVANVVRYGAPLPGREASAMDKQVIFDDDTQVRGLASLKIFPLSAGNRILGTLVAGSRRKGAFDGDALRMLEVMAIQAAQAVLRAQLFEQMETMATTDGLTSLLNHRTFQQRFDEAVSQARRYGRKVSLILTDIDHFKSVNDTWGHPTGDLVLKGVARLLKEQARDTDIVARYGGEEFALIMPETDERGAKVIAERIREAIAKHVFQTEQGPLRVTLSLGVSTFPESTTDRQALVDLADQCLYVAKRHGRNQSVAVADMHKVRRAPAVADNAHPHP